MSAVNGTVDNKLFEECSVNGSESKVRQSLEIVEHGHDQVGAKIGLMIELGPNVGAKMGEEMVNVLKQLRQKVLHLGDRFWNLCHLVDHLVLG